MKQWEVYEYDFESPIGKHELLTITGDQFLLREVIIFVFVNHLVASPTKRQKIIHGRLKEASLVAPVVNLNVILTEADWAFPSISVKDSLPEQLPVFGL